MINKNSLFLLIFFCFFLGENDSLARIVKDEIGRVIEISSTVNGVVGLTPSLTEGLYALELEEKVRGVTIWSNYPKRTENLPKIGSYSAPNIEHLLNLELDLILTMFEGNPGWIVGKAELVKIPIYIASFNKLKYIFLDFIKLGRICGVEKKGLILTRIFKNRFVLLKQQVFKVPLVSSFLIIGSQPTVSVSEGSVEHDLLLMARAYNLCNGISGSWPKINLEFLISSTPHVFMISTMSDTKDLNYELNLWKTLLGIKVKVICVNSDLVNRPGPRLSLGFEILVKLIHPGLLN